MSFKRSAAFAPNPVTARGVSTKLSASKDKVVYTNGKTVIIRDLKTPNQATVYSEHVKATTVARISPSGYYCASADVSGTVKVWDTVGEDQVLKGEYKVISGRVNDLAWDGESKRILAVGDGREKFGHAFMMDTGSSTGEVAGHSKVINAVSIRHQRPFRAATAGDDNLIVFHTGAPYKYEKTIRTHTKFVQDVRYASSGDHFASVGSDSKIFLYDGKTGDTVAEITDSPHKGSIMACSWSTDNKSLITSSADRTVKLWDVETRKAVQTWTLGTGISHQQMGNTWSGEQDIVSLSLSGDLNLFDPRTGEKPTRVFRAPQTSITALAPLNSSTFIAGTAEGRIFSYSDDASSCLEGEGHTALVTGVASSPTDGKAYSIGWDDRVREIERDGKNFVPASASTIAQPRSIAVTSDSTVFIVELAKGSELGNIEAFRSNQKVFNLQPKFTPVSVATSGSTVAIGGNDGKVRLNQWDGKTLSETTVLEGKGKSQEVTFIAFSPDAKYLASGDKSGRITLFDVKEQKIIPTNWEFHRSAIKSLSWTADSRHLASGSQDTDVYVWSIEKPVKNIAIKNAGQRSGINGVLWIDESAGKGKLAAASDDATVRIWDIVFH
ncbi:WD40 repeat-like protein [Crucibulum laeve]|uniref:WD40 repeat-like protein n=1 Tax=Crucibulum laeve TaxID=68775 RepID=A0A5C3LJE5_9AGAR|nr:WD40 repeat-like protein [Crucibulum laeve]